MNLQEEVERIKREGYSEENAAAKLCQDIVIKAISMSSFRRNVTIKGGVVLRSLSGEVRRATQDLDLDFIKYSISEDSMRLFIDRLNCIDGIRLKIVAPIENLKHQDYKGKRMHIEISDKDENVLQLKLDVGVHKDLDIEQEEYCFDVCCQEDSASVLINSKAQMVAEKLKSMMRFGAQSTRYKDVFDICYLSDTVDMNMLRKCIQRYILEDETIDVWSKEDIYNRAEQLFSSSTYKKQVEQSQKNWLDLTINEVMEKNLAFIHRI